MKRSEKHCKPIPLTLRFFSVGKHPGNLKVKFKNRFSFILGTASTSDSPAAFPSSLLVCISLPTTSNIYLVTTTQLLSLPHMNL
ncbi:hypothetical protein VTL71DRAFT_4541 [Oculimacula yallundae]|uniref:Uncharacterized protein n=1 Tax=Oculimacula yallundae TaxID=86028 RepID=A0ABR4C2Y0_9HELO